MADRKPSPAPGEDPLATRVLGGGVRAGRAIAGATGVDRALDTAAEEAIVRALDSPAVERAVIRLADEGRLEEVLVAAAAHVDVEGLVGRAIESDAADRIWEDILASDKAQMLVERVAEAPEVRAAIAQQGFGLVSDIGRQVSRLTEGLDDVLERIACGLLRRHGASEEDDEAGLVTRGLAFGIDLALLLGLFTLTSALLTSIITFFGGDGAPGWAAALYSFFGLAVGGALFVTFWYLVGQTPGMRFLGIRVTGLDRGSVPFGDAVRRVLAIPLALIPFGLGFLVILISPRRRGWHDRIARTVVIYDDNAAPWSTGTGGAETRIRGRRHAHGS